VTIENRSTYSGLFNRLTPFLVQILKTPESEIENGQTGVTNTYIAICLDITTRFVRSIPQPIPDEMVTQLYPVVIEKTLQSVDTQVRVKNEFQFLTKILNCVKKFWFWTKLPILQNNFDFSLKVWFSTKISIFHQNFDFWQISMFHQNFDFWQKSMFQQNFDFWQISMFHQNFDFWQISMFHQNFDFWQISMFQQNFDFSPKNRFCTQISMFQKNLDFSPKISISRQNFDFRQKFDFGLKFRCFPKLSICDQKFNFDQNSAF